MKSMNKFYLSVIAPGAIEMVQECSTLEDAKHNRRLAINYYDGLCTTYIFQFQKTGNIYNPVIRIPIERITWIQKNW